MSRRKHCPVKVAPTVVCKNIRAEWSDTESEYPQDHAEVWRVIRTNASDKLELLRSFLNEAEKERMERFHRDEDRLSFVNRRGMLRWLSSRYLRCDPRDIRFAEGINHKPLFAEAPLYFNVSGSGDLVLIAFAPSELGVDIEKIRTDFSYQDIVDYCFTREEQQLVKHSENPLNDFYTLWTRKEAVVKQNGKGIDEQFRNIEVTHNTAASPPGGSKRVQVYSFDAGSGYRGSFASRDNLPLRFLTIGAEEIY